MLIRWYKKYNEYIDRLLLKWFSKKQVDEFTIIENLLNSINPQLLYGINSSNNSLKMISSQYPNIGELNEKIKDCLFKLSHNAPIGYHYADTSISTIYVHNYFISTKGFYISEVSAVQDFKHNALLYIKLIRKLSIHTFGVEEHNFRILTHFTKGIKETAVSIFSLQP